MKHTSTIYGDTHRRKLQVCFKVADNSFSCLSVATAGMQLAMLAGPEHLPPWQLLWPIQPRLSLQCVATAEPLRQQQSQRTPTK